MAALSKLADNKNAIVSAVGVSAALWIILFGQRSSKSSGWVNYFQIVNCCSAQQHLQCSAVKVNEMQFPRIAMLPHATIYDLSISINPSRLGDSNNKWYTDTYDQFSQHFRNSKLIIAHNLRLVGSQIPPHSSSIQPSISEVATVKPKVCSLRRSPSSPAEPYYIFRNSAQHSPHD